MLKDLTIVASNGNFSQIPPSDYSKISFDERAEVIHTLSTMTEEQKRDTNSSSDEEATNL